MNRYLKSIESPVGRISIVTDETHLKSVTFSDEMIEASETQPEVLLRTVVQLNEYFEGTRTKFELDLAMNFWRSPKKNPCRD